MAIHQSNKKQLSKPVLQGKKQCEVQRRVPSQDNVLDDEYAPAEDNEQNNSNEEDPHEIRKSSANSLLHTKKVISYLIILMNYNRLAFYFS